MLEVASIESHGSSMSQDQVVSQAAGAKSVSNFRDPERCQRNSHPSIHFDIEVILLQLASVQDRIALGLSSGVRTIVVIPL
jgi:hypothetical protein